MLIVAGVVAICIYIMLYRVTALETFEVRPKSRIAIATLMRSPLELPYWMQRYRDQGVVGFFIRLEDSPNWVRYLQDQPDVFDLEIGQSQPGTSNYHSLMDRQQTYVDKVLHDLAGAHDIDFVLHLDQDELLDGSLDVFDLMQQDIKTVHLENFEAVYDVDSQSSACFEAVEFVRCKHSKCRSYANGKGGGRPMNDVSFAGPHYFKYREQMTGAHHREIPPDVLRVLHFDSCTLGAFVSKFHHIGKKVDLKNIPFSAYPDAIRASTQAHEVYRRLASG